MINPIIATQELSFQYKGGIPIKFPAIQIQKAQHTLLLGNSGTGKTTLLHLLGGLSKPTAGKVWINEKDIYAMSTSEMDKFRSQHIGFIFQEAHLLKNLTILENIQLAQSLAKKTVNKNEVLSVLDKLQLSDKAHAYPQELSRGQLQRAAIARAVINKPLLLIADEPTASLDDQNTTRVLTLLMEIADQQGATLLIATHDKRIKNNFSNTYDLNTLNPNSK
ncbi:ABC transporter ATP-binding protein [Sphingobacterium anhuiense]|uniref:ABC transporter ATP-binding protein n=1 Tax=Sphingobacterium anhuiense TaxID=493780 RepID=A0ABW5Z3A7_9SPHI